MALDKSFSVVRRVTRQSVDLLLGDLDAFLISGCVDHRMGEEVARLAGCDSQLGGDTGLDLRDCAEGGDASGDSIGDGYDLASAGACGNTGAWKAAPLIARRSIEAAQTDPGFHTVSADCHAEIVTSTADVERLFSAAGALRQRQIWSSASLAYAKYDSMYTLLNRLCQTCALAVLGLQPLRLMMTTPFARVIAHVFAR